WRLSTTPTLRGSRRRTWWTLGHCWNRWPREKQVFQVGSATDIDREWPDRGSWHGCRQTSPSAGPSGSCGRHPGRRRCTGQPAKRDRAVEHWLSYVDSREDIRHVGNGSDGRMARLEKLAEPELCPNEHSENYERPCFGVDVVIEGGTLDHVELYAFQTGWGMAMKPGELKVEPPKRVSRPPARDIG